MAKTTKRIRPVYLMCQEGTLDFEKRAVLDGIRELVGLAETDLDVVDLGVWKASDYQNKEESSLKEFRSVDWYIERGRKASRNSVQLDAHEMVSLMWTDYWSAKGSDRDGYTVLLVHDDIYGGDTNFVVGSTIEGIGTVISARRFETLDKNTRYECIKTVAMHEAGHIFGLLPDSRKENVEESLGNHCTNTCIMRQGLMVPADDIRMSEDRLKYGALCKTCKDDLVAYFGK